MQLFKEAYTSLKFRDLNEFGNLRLTPIFIDEEIPPDGFVGFDELFDKGLVDASELSESGVVGRISVTNKSDCHLSYSTVRRLWVLSRIESSNDQ